MEIPAGLQARVEVKLTKYDEHNNVIGTEVKEVLMTEEEVKKLWESQMQP